jgi:hypothetical protein
MAPATPLPTCLAQTHQLNDQRKYPSPPSASEKLSANSHSGSAAPTAAKSNVLHKDPPPNHPVAGAMAGEGTYPQDTTGAGNY